MTVNDKIITAVGTVASDAVQPNYYLPDEDKPERYFVFQYSTGGDYYADGMPQYDKNMIMLHYFCPRDDDTVKLVRKIRKALFKAGFSWPRKVDASDAEEQHIVFEFELREKVDIDGED